FCWLACRCCLRSLALARLRCSSVAKPALISWSRRELLIGPVLADSSWLKIVTPMVSHDAEPGIVQVAGLGLCPGKPPPLTSPGGQLTAVLLTIILAAPLLAGTAYVPHRLPIHTQHSGRTWLLRILLIGTGFGLGWLGTVWFPHATQAMRWA